MEDDSVQKRSNYYTFSKLTKLDGIANSLRNLYFYKIHIQLSLILALFTSPISTFKFSLYGDIGIWGGINFTR